MNWTSDHSIQYLKSNPMNKKVKIAYCIPSLYYPSGMERVLTLKANYFAEHLGYDIHIILTDGKGKEPYYKLYPSITTHQLDINYDELYGLSLPKRIHRYWSKQKLFKKRLETCLNEIEPDITISLLRRDINFINKMKDKSIKLGEIHFNKSNYREFSDNCLPGIIQRAVKQYWMWQLIRQVRQLKSFVVLSHEDAAEWTELNNVTVIYNPLPFLPEQLQNQIYELGISPSCILEHSTPDIVDKYCKSSIFVLSSRYEGFGMVIIEAMACGVPPVSFTCPCGPRDIISDGINGLLVENGNIEGLAEKICYLIENENVRREMGRQARMDIERFRIEPIAEQWKTLFESIIEKNKDL